MCLGNWNDPPLTSVPEPILKDWKNPELGRDVDHFDENRLEYVYRDQILRDSTIFRWETPALPDVYTQDITTRSNYVPQTKRYRRVVQDQLKINGRRFRINHKADHTQELIPIR